MTNVFQFFSIQWPCYNKWLAVMHSQSMLSYFAHSLATAVSFTLQKKDERDRSMLQNVCSLISINVLQLHSQSQEVSEKKTQYIESIDFFVRQTFIGPRIEPSTCNKSMFFFRFTLSLHKVVARDKRKPIKLLNCSIAEWPWLIQHNRRRRRKKTPFWLRAYNQTRQTTRELWSDRFESERYADCKKPKNRITNNFR